MRPALILTHAPHEGPGLIGPGLGAPYRVRTVLDDPAAQLPDVDELSGLVVMGGPMDADDLDGHPGLAAEQKLLGAAVDAGVPVLAVCLGMQLLFDSSDESPGVPGLGILPGQLRLLPDTVKRPQMQWNLLERHGECRLLADAPDPAWAYFVHSYAAETDPELVSATCDYGGPVVAAVERGPVWATQFHPEKSSHTGLAALGTFVRAAAAAGAAA